MANRWQTTKAVQDKYCYVLWISRLQNHNLHYGHKTLFRVNGAEVDWMKIKEGHEDSIRTMMVMIWNNCWRVLLVFLLLKREEEEEGEDEAKTKGEQLLNVPGRGKYIIIAHFHSRLSLSLNQGGANVHLWLELHILASDSWFSILRKPMIDLLLAIEEKGD